VPVEALERPFSVDGGWSSGYVVAPQIGWRPFALRYRSTQLQRRLTPALIGSRSLKPDLPVTVERPQGNAMLFCQPPKPRFASLCRTAAVSLRLLSALPAFF
jgi:hypothetical protein